MITLTNTLRHVRVGFAVMVQRVLMVSIVVLPNLLTDTEL